jgi:nucleotide-binding universal stress UspA family protein
MFTRVLVPLDGSDLAERALDPAVGLARLTGASLHLLRVVDVARLDGRGLAGAALEYAYPAALLDTEATDAGAYVDQVRGRLAARGLENRVEVEVRHGVAPREIAARARPGDLIVMATHGRGGVARWFLGSVAEEVVRRAAVPVLLVRAQPTAEAVAGADAAPAAETS